MKKIALALIICAATATSALGFGGGLGIPVGDPLEGIPNGVPEIDGAKVNAFWSCFFTVGCNAFTLDLSDVSDDADEVKDNE